jgi:hypothetical protein
VVEVGVVVRQRDRVEFRPGGVKADQLFLEVRPLAGGRARQAADKVETPVQVGLSPPCSQRPDAAGRRSGYGFVSQERSQMLTTKERRAASRSDLERLSVALLQNEMPLPKPVRLLGISLSPLQHAADAEPQLALPM